MASSIALRRARISRLLFSNLFPPASASASYNTDAPVVDVDRRPYRSVSRRRDNSPSFFQADVFDPFSPSRSLSQVLNVMDRFMENPFLSQVPRRGWDVKEDDDALTLKIDMPGLGKEDVKISVQHNTLIIRGESQNESDGGVEEISEAETRSYSSRMELPPNLYKIDEIKAEMKNGVLKLVVPKVKEEEAKNVFQVNVE